MEDIREEYKIEKCSKCKNKKANISVDRCNIKTYQYGNYLYCRCINLETEGRDLQEIKKKII